MRKNPAFPVVASFVFLAASGVMACNTAHPTATSGGSGTFAGTSPPTAGTVSVSSSTGTSAEAGAGTDAGAAASSSSSDGGDAAAMPPAPIDAPPRPQTHTDDLCNVSPIAWWSTGAAVDPTVVTPELATALNALFGLPNAHPITLAGYIAAEGGSEPAGWRFKATASLTNGIGQQYFPFDHAATSVTAARTATEVGTGEHEASAWMHVVDGAGADVWLPLLDVDVHATVPDSYCAHLGGGVLTATLAHTASAISMTLVDGSLTNLAGLLGAEGAAGGWPLRLTFEAEKVQISLK
ncbi:MAG: hypothetical protein QOI41_7001 [Myxococcales bacterium]|nr:hypothetical protein [Myxococcales bacterium]